MRNGHFPSKILCNSPVLSQSPFLELHLRANELRSASQYKIRVLLRHGVPKQQKSKESCRQSACFDILSKAGRPHKREVFGFSIEPATPHLNASWANEAVTRAQALPSRVFSASAVDKSGSPRGNWSLRRGGGPCPRSLARENEEHGVPKWMTSMSSPGWHLQ